MNRYITNQTKLSKLSVKKDILCCWDLSFCENLECIYLDLTVM